MPTVNRRNWSNQPWLLITNDDLKVEYKQATEEGRNLASVEVEFDTLAALDLGMEENQQRAEALLDTIQDLPIVDGYGYIEPSALAEIQAVRPAPVELPTALPEDAILRDKALGAWLGRCSGCLLGKPAEGRRSWQIEKYLKEQNRWPLENYFSNNASEELAKDCGFPVQWKGLFEEDITCMPEDDDTNYTTVGFAICEQFGPDFTPENVASFWLSNIPLFHVCTAERIAYRNLVASIGPVESAWYRNVYREWIGAQIRADYFGYVNPANPERAADFAWRDAAISHIKNGIYGEMWVAAMLAAAYVCDDVETIIHAGLAQVPEKCRLAENVLHIIELYKNGTNYDEAVADMNTRWSENLGHDWCHTISNAEICAIALLWGDLDFEKSICMSVMPGFDTDCNGATVGSIVGMIIGGKKLPAKWIAPMNDTLLTGVAGYHKVSISRMAEQTVEMIKKFAG